MRRLRPVLLVLVLLLCTGVGAWVVPRLAGPATYSTTVADVQLRLGLTTPADRGVDLYVPLADWGLRAPVVDAPVRVRVEPRRINRVGVVRTVTTGGPATIAQLRSELDAALRSFLIRSALLLLAGGLLGGALAVLVWHAAGVRGRRLLLGPAAAVGLVVVGAGALTAWSVTSFDADRLDEPSYYASGVELERIVGQADALRASAGKYSSRVDNALRSITGLLGDGAGATSPLAPAGAEDADTRRLVLASDVHNNLLTLPTLKRYAGGAPTVLAGDFTINGGEMESPLIDRMAAVSDTVVAVSGNHDSPGVMRTFERAGVTVLDHTDGVQEIGGIRMAGFEDPLAFAEGDFPDGIRSGMSFGDIEDGKALMAQAEEERWRWWQALPERPQVLVVHQEALGRDLAQRIWEADPDGAPLTILVGHTHRQRLDRYGPVTVVNSGSIGAGGLFGINEQSVGLALLDLERDDNALEATTLISQNPSTSAAQARRVVTASPDCDESLVYCHDLDDAEEPEDDPGETASPTPTPNP